MTDEELLLMYRNYKNKRMFVIIVLILLIVISSLIILKFPKINDNEDSKTEDVKKVIENKDVIPPVLELKEQSIDIFVDDDLDYLFYVSKAEDDVDGDLIDNVEYIKINTSVIGEQKVIYSLVDSSNNKTTKELIVNIKAKEELPNNSSSEQKNENQQPDNSSENKNTSANNNSNKDQSKNESSSKVEKIVKYFMFSDGYTMENVANACASELKKYNRSGMCIPIQDEDGIYLGMKMEIN